MRFFTNILGPLVGLLLLASEIALIGLGLFRPRVSQEYYNFFISQRQSCWLPDNAVQQAQAELAAPAYSITKLPAAARCYLLETGWSEVDSTGVWTDDKTAYIQLPPSAKPRLLQLTLNAFAAGKDQTVTVAAGRKFLKTLQVPRQEINLFQVTLPPAPMKPLVLTFDVANPVAPAALGQGNDTRLLGIQLIGLAWLPQKR
jgi:hypothetical protein